MLYVCPAAISIIFNIYHFFNLLNWYSATIACKLSGGVYSGACIRPEQPMAEYYIINVTMSFVIGVATGLWIFSPKTWKSWSNVLCCCLSNKKVKQKTFYNGITEYAIDSPQLTSGFHRYSSGVYPNQFFLARPLLLSQQQQQQHQILNGHTINTINLSSSNATKMKQKNLQINSHLSGQNAPPPSSNSDLGYNPYYSNGELYYTSGETKLISCTANNSILQQQPRHVLATTTNNKTSNLNIL